MPVLFEEKLLPNIWQVTDLTVRARLILPAMREIAGRRRVEELVQLDDCVVYLAFVAAVECLLKKLQLIGLISVIGDAAGTRRTL